MGGEDEGEKALLVQGLPTSDDLPDDGDRERTGTPWTAGAHIIAGLIGSGVLSLAWSVAQLGWIAGPLCMLFCAATTLVSAFLLADCYRYPDPAYGHVRNNYYMKAVRLFLDVCPEAGRAVFQTVECDLVVEKLGVECPHV